jgi:hypothetical protein
MLDTKDLCNLSFVVLRVVPRDAKFVCNLDVIVLEDLEDKC